MDGSKIEGLRAIHRDLAVYLKKQHEAMSNCLLTAAALRKTLDSDPNLRKSYKTNRQALLTDETFQAGLSPSTSLERLLRRLAEW
jgi:hypothetical protein